MGFFLPALIACAWGDPFGGFFVGGFVRLMPQYHSTWSVNSITHTFGIRPYNGSSATNGYTFMKSFDPVRWLLALLSILLAVLTVGESFNHATHHEYPWALHEHWSLSKWFAILCQKLGLIQGIKFAPKTAK
jgi:stearoyl-CoA desaturase (delta-9 desaturase)